MPTVADCLRQHGRPYLIRYGSRVPLEHRRVIDAITRCQTGELGGALFKCRRCGRMHATARSCGNRHCPNCQHHKTQVWLAKRTSALLPVHYFLITFTVPWQLRAVLRAHPQVGYDAIFNAGRETIGELASNPKWLGTRQLGFFGVLQTWGRDPRRYHPHVHFVVPGGGVSENGSQWLSTPENFFFPEPCASPIYRAKFRDLMEEAGLKDSVPAELWEHDKWWEVDVKAVGNGQGALKYLAPYIFRVALCDNRIVSCDEHHVTYRYTPSKSKRVLTREVSGEEFVQAFVQHILPHGYKKVRYYGWLAGHHHMRLDRVRWLVFLFLGWIYWLRSRRDEPVSSRPPLRCAHCGGELQLWMLTNAVGRVLYNHPLAYLDSG